MHLWATDLRDYTAECRTPSDIFDGVSLPMIMSNLNKFGSFTLGRDQPHLAKPNTCIFIFISFIINYRESHLDAVRFELTTHSPKMVN